MKKVLIIIVFTIFLTVTQAFATITLNGTTVELSGTVTANDILNSPYFTSTNNLVTLNYDVTLKDGVVLELRGLIINVNGKFFIPETFTNAPEITGVVFIVDNSSDHWKARYMNLKNSMVSMYKNGSSILSLSKADNVIVASEGTPSGGTANKSGSIFLQTGGVFSNISLDNVDRLGLEGGGTGPNIAFWVKNLNYKAYNTAMKIGYNIAPSSIWEDLTHENTSSFFIDTYRANDANHTILLLGTSINTFYRGGSTFARSYAHGNTRLRTGGIKYWKIIDGEGAKLTVYDSRSIISPQRLVLTTDNWELLTAATDITVPATEKIEFMVNTGEKTGTVNTTALTAITDQKVFVKKFGKRVLAKYYTNQSDAEFTEGSALAHTPKVLRDETFINETEANIRAYTEIANLDQFAERLHVLALDTDRSDIQADGNFATYSEGEINLGAYNLVVDDTAGSVIDFNNGTNTITVKSSALATGSSFSSIRTTGNVTLQGGSVLRTGYIDSSGTYMYIKLTSLDQQDILVTDQQNAASPTTLINQTNQTGSYSTLLQLPAGGVINVMVERDSYAPWMETIPDGDLNFTREVSTSLSAITAENQLKTIDLLIKLLQKTEAVLNATNAQPSTPSVSVSITTTAISGGPSVDNQDAELALLRRILAKMTAVRETVNKN